MLEHAQKTITCSRQNKFYGFFSRDSSLPPINVANTGPQWPTVMVSLCTVELLRLPATYSRFVFIQVCLYL